MGQSARGGWVRTWIMPAAVLMQMCMGSPYAWSVFQRAIVEADPSLSQGRSQLPYWVFYTAFPLTVIFSRALLHALGPRLCSVAGALFFGGGWMLASLGGDSFNWVIAGVGLLGGIGVGFAYLVPIAVGMVWFPRHKGLVTGVAVAGFGFGAFLIAQISGRLFRLPDFSPYRAFLYFGAPFLVLILLAGLMMQFPPRHRAEKIVPLPMRAFFGTSAFWLLYGGMFCGVSAGLMTIANMTRLNEGLGLRAGGTAVMIFALFNASGRIAWGWLADRTGPLRAIGANLLAQALMLALVPWLARDAKGLYCVAAWVGLNYGGVLVLYATACARRWGVDRVSQVYAWMFTVNIFAGLTPVLAGNWFDRYHSFDGPIWLAAGLLLVALAAIRGLPDADPKAAVAVPPRLPVGTAGVV